MTPEHAERRRWALWRKRKRLERVFSRHRRGCSGWTRRVRRTVLTALLKGVGLYQRGLRNAGAVRRIDHTVAFGHLPPAFDGFRILFLSDLHFGGPDDGDALEPLVREAAPDLCLLGGDFPWGYGGPAGVFVPALERVLGPIRPVHGTFSALGNHDYSSHTDALRNLGIEPLVNRAVPIERDGATLWLAGIDDPSHFGVDDLTAALHGLPPDAFTVLLAHAPDRYREAAQAGVALYLCGHTHGGQIRLPLLGAPYLNSVAPRRYCAGRWTCNGTQGYTTHGVGTTDVPVRYGCPPEAVVLTLRREGSSRHGA
jgi:hypothetical protein